MSNAKKKRVSLRGSKGTIQRVLKLIQPYHGLVLFTLLLAAVTVLTTLYAPILSGRGVDLIVGQGNVNFPALGKIAIQFGVTVCVTSICQWLMNMVNNRITFQVVCDIRVQAFQHMEILPLSYMDAHKPGDAISRINTDVEQFSDGLLMGFTQLFTGILTIVGTLGFMLSIDWRITLIVVVLTPLSIFVAKFIAEHTYDMFRVQSETRAELTGLVDELIGNEHLVRAFGYESRAEERFDKINADLENNWAVVAEGIQTILRRENYPNPYEALKALTRTNKPIGKADIRDFIERLEVSESVKQELRALSPQTYTGVCKY